MDVIKKHGPRMPILGICLGHQGIISAFGGSVINAGKVRHGKTSKITHNDDSLFDGISNPFQATRYHSLVGANDSEIISDPLQILQSCPISSCPRGSL